MSGNKKIKVLVAEDDYLASREIVRTLKHIGYHDIWEADDGVEAVEMTCDKCPDVVLMDMEMPELDGVDATVEIRGLGFQMPIVAMTATSSKLGKDNAITSGMNDYITKPVKIEAVKGVLFKWFS